MELDYEKLYKNIVESEPHGSAIETMAQDVQRLKEDNKKLLFQLQDEAMFGMKMVEDKSKLEDANKEVHRALLEIGAINIKLKEKLRKYEILQYSPNELEILLNRYTKLKYDLRRFDVLDCIEENDTIDDYSVKEKETLQNFGDRIEEMIVYDKSI